MRIIVILFLLFSITACSSTQFYKVLDIRHDEGEIIRRDDYAVFKMLITLEKEANVSAFKKLPVPKDVYLLIEKESYSMALCEEIEDSHIRHSYRYFTTVPRGKFKEGIKYCFSYKVEDNKIRTDYFTLKYEAF